MPSKLTGFEYISKHTHRYLVYKLNLGLSCDFSRVSPFWICLTALGALSVLSVKWILKVKDCLVLSFYVNETPLCRVLHCRHPVQHFGFASRLILKFLSFSYACPNIYRVYEWTGIWDLTLKALYGCEWAYMKCDFLGSLVSWGFVLLASLVLNVWNTPMTKKVFIIKCLLSEKV